MYSVCSPATTESTNSHPTMTASAYSHAPMNNGHGPLHVQNQLYTGPERRDLGGNAQQYHQSKQYPEKDPRLLGQECIGGESRGERMSKEQEALGRATGESKDQHGLMVNLNGNC